MQQGKFNPELITPCGMNCGICKWYLAYSRGISEEKGKVIHCQGCLPLNKKCFIKRGCKKLLKNEIKFCFECENIPCKNLDRLDRRYQKHYNMSMIENLKDLKEKGMKEFLKTQEKKYECPKCRDVVSVHDGKCYKCGYKKLSGNFVENKYLQQLADKSMTKEELLKNVKLDFSLLPIILQGVSSSKAPIRYGCAKVLMDLSEEYPQQLYPYMDFFIDLLDSKYRIITWNAMAVIANLTKIDEDEKFDAVFDKYYHFINDEYMVTVANLVGHSGKIAVAKPYLTEKIANELLKVEHISTTPHLTEECKRVIAEQAIKSFDMFFDGVERKDKVIAFMERQLTSSRKTLRDEAEKFLKKYVS